MNSSTQKQENVFLNLAFNILIPIFILNKLSEKIGPGVALILALSFPLAYGLMDYRRTKKANIFSILGMTNTLLTGGLAYLNLGGIWFAAKEAAFPSLIGFAVLYSAFTKKTAIEVLFLNPNLFNIEQVQARITEQKKEDEFAGLLKKSTIFLGFSFFLSALLNFFLAQRIFTPLDQILDLSERQIKLNEQIAQMHQWSFLVILAPSIIFLGAILYSLVRGIKVMTGLRDEEIFKT